MNRPDTYPASFRRLSGIVGIFLAGLVLSWRLPSAGFASAGLLVLAVPGGSDRDLLAMVGWILVGAVVMGGAAWLATELVDLPVPRTVAVGLGAAVGGGTGAAMDLLSGEPRLPDDETVTLDSGGSISRESGPKPADLFERSPDPMLYYGTEGGDPVVRTVNPAFAETFGVSEGERVDAPLSETVPAGDVDRVLAAVREGDAYEATVEGPEGTEAGPLLLRVIGVADETGARGYVAYTSLDR